MLDARETTAYLIECDGDITAIEEVLSCYVTWKLIKGSSVLYCLTKLRNLIRYLRMHGHGDIVEHARDVFRVIGLEISLNGGRIGISPTSTSIGRRIVNEIRRSAAFSGSASQNIRTDELLGGPFTIAAGLRPSQLTPVGLGYTQLSAAVGGGSSGTADPQTTTSWTEASREPWQERWFAERPQLRGTVPAYPYAARAEDEDNLGTLPRYHSAASRSSHVLAVGVDTLRSLSTEAANEYQSMSDELGHETAGEAAIPLLAVANSTDTGCVATFATPSAAPSAQQADNHIQMGR